ncbi:MAG TPA: ABC transporter ATP-binding protein [Candidatus Dormibacteraeota bacterium]|nr:ABC transporter ATP-binding protein [Candidatus Dormibacteraeota bacterium]
MLECEGLHVAYGRVGVLRGVSLTVRPDELVALIGPNGAGKSTTLKSIVGLLRPARGGVTFDGASLVGSDPADIVARGIALVPQGRMIFQTLTVRENLRLGAYRAAAGEVEGRVERVLSAFPALAERLRQMGGTLSGGEQQMLAIARALMSNPTLLILDEPSTGLAPTMVESIFRTIQDLHRRGTMVLLVEQNAHIALELASRAYVLEQGSIVAEGPAAALRQDARVVAAYLG